MMFDFDDDFSTHEKGRSINDLCQKFLDKVAGVYKIYLCAKIIEFILFTFFEMHGLSFDSCKLYNT